MKTNKSDKEALRRYFFIVYEIKTFFKTFKGDMAAHTIEGKYVNKVILISKLQAAYKKARRILILNIQELKRADYEEYNLKFTPSGVKVQPLKPTAMNTKKRDKK